MYDDLQLEVGTSKISSSTKARNLGVIFDKFMNLDAHIGNICKSTYFQLKNIGSIRNVLSDDACAQLIHCLVTVRIDYCNSLLYGMSDSSLFRLQKILNTAARILCRIPKHDHISSTLRDLHWLHIRQRITFKILILTYQAYHNTAPSYLCDMIVPYLNARNLRSDHKLLITPCVPRPKLKTYGEKCFQYAGPEEWNNLPLEIRNSTSLSIFKCKLKTHLFQLAYPS